MTNPSPEQEHLEELAEDENDGAGSIPETEQSSEECDSTDSSEQDGDSGAGSEEDSPPSELEKVCQERDNFKDKWLRSVAELENFRKRTRREMAQSRERAMGDLAGRMIEVLDNLDRALDAIPDDQRETELTRGVEMVRTQFLDQLRGAGVEPLDPSGKPFDPHFHEALLEEPREDMEPGTVIEELIRGYRMGEVLVRASKVRVSKAPAPNADENSGDPESPSPGEDED